MRNRRYLAAASLAGLALVASTARPPSGPSSASASARPAAPQEAGDDERAYERELGRRSLEGNCLMCHSAEMIEGQRLTPEQWAAEVEKMIGWGSPVPPEEKDLLTAYLAERFPVEGAAPEVARLTLDEAIAPTRPEPAPDALPEGDAARGASVHAEHCATCHGPDGLGGDLGVNLLARSILLRPADFAEVLRRGRHRMPGFQVVLDDQQMADALAWLRSRSE